MELPAHGLYGILDADTVPARNHVQAAEAALAGGIGMLQYRDKHSDAATTASHARALLAACRQANVPFIVNDAVETAAAIGADGVHLGQADTAVADARNQLGCEAIIGATCHANLDAALAAARAGADYVSFGRFFASTTKPDAPPANPAILEQASKRLAVPVVAIGGVDADNGRILLNAGADWLAVSGAVFGATDQRAAAANIAGLFS